MILHVACLPFPSPQGTQAAIDAMLRASAEEGQPAHLLTYAHGADDTPRPYTLHRLPDFPKVRSLRSGPSLGKVALDLRCIGSTRRLVRRLRPRAIVAHHIEAALACIAARVRPLYYVAHTSLSAELPEYFPRLPFELPSLAGRAAEQWACARVDGVGAVVLAAALYQDWIDAPGGMSVDNLPTFYGEISFAIEKKADQYTFSIHGTAKPPVNGIRIRNFNGSQMPDRVVINGIARSVAARRIAFSSK